MNFTAGSRSRCQRQAFLACLAVSLAACTAAQRNTVERSIAGQAATVAPGGAIAQCTAGCSGDEMCQHMCRERHDPMAGGGTGGIGEVGIQATQTPESRYVREPTVTVTRHAADPQTGPAISIDPFATGGAPGPETAAGPGTTTALPEAAFP